jgi:arylesterase / paraoxonase
MVSLLSNLAGLVALIAVLYQFALKNVIFTTLGYGRVLDPLSSFGAHCERVEGLQLEGCEDMWLHKPSGMLYMACSNSLSRVQWLPS